MTKEIKNENIHEDFSQKEIRNYLAKELELNGGIYVSIKYIEKQIEEFKKLLKQRENYESVLHLIKEKGWEDWDVSEYVPYNKETYFPFIGTEDEFNKVLELLKKGGDKNDKKRK